MSKQQTEAQYLVQWMEAVPLGSVDERVIAELKRLESVNDELLEAAKAALQVFINQGWEEDLLAARKLCDAIAKATGETK